VARRGHDVLPVHPKGASDEIRDDGFGDPRFALSRRAALGLIGLELNF